MFGIESLVWIRFANWRSEDWFVQIGAKCRCELGQEVTSSGGVLLSADMSSVLQVTLQPVLWRSFLHEQRSVSEDQRIPQQLLGLGGRG